MTTFGTELGWWLLPAVVVGQLLAEVARRRVGRLRTESRRDAAAAAQLRQALKARLRTSPPARGPADKAVHKAWRGQVARYRRRSRAARRRAGATVLALVLVWLGAQGAAWYGQLNADWDVLPGADTSDWGPVVGGCAGVSLLLLWWALRRSGHAFALARSVGYLLLIACGTLSAALLTDSQSVRVGTEAPSSTAVSVLAIAVSPVVRRVVAPGVGARPAPALPSEVQEQVRVLAGSGVLPPPRSGAAAARTPRPVPPKPPVPPKHPAPVVSSTRRRRVVTSKLLDVVPRAAVTVHGPIERHPHILRASTAASAEPLVFKEFEVAGVGGNRPRNPVRPLKPYRELLSRVNLLPPADLAHAERVLLLPRAVVASGDDAVGVLYPLLGGPFRRRGDSGAQTGDFLWAAEPEHMRCAIVTEDQRGRILLDVVRAHELLHQVEVAHGDTAWKNFVYGVEPDGQASGILIDVDGMTAFGDPDPVLLSQIWWEVDGGTSPADRDLVRVARLIARLAASPPRPDLAAAPDTAAVWFTPWLRHLTTKALSQPGSVVPLAEFRAALAEALY